MCRRIMLAYIVLAMAPWIGFSQDASQLPIRKVVLYKNGIAYFEHFGTVPQKQDVEILLPSAQLNDVLKSLTVIDPDRGQVPGVSFDSAEPLERRLAELPLQLNSAQNLLDFLNRIRGAEVEVRAAPSPVAGKLMGAEIRRKQVGEYTVREAIELAIFTPQGDLRTVELASPAALRLVKKDLATDVNRYLEILDSAHQRDVRRLRLLTSAAGTQRLQVSYTSEAPVWKTTYRLVLDDNSKPLLQGWAIVDNTTAMDWTNVNLSLVAGAPVSFIQELSKPLYSRRPVVPLPAGLVVTPQTHEATLALPSGQSGISGAVRDATGAAIPGASVAATSPDGVIRQAIADNTGRYYLTLVPGTYQVEASNTGFQRIQQRGVEVAAGRVLALDFNLRVAAVSETVEVRAEASSLNTSTSSTRTGRGTAGPGSGGGIGSGRGGGVGAGSGGGIGGGTFRPTESFTPPPATLREQTLDVAQAARAGEQFEYKLPQAVTIHKNQSALLPILHRELDGEKVTLFNEESSDKRPRLAVWLKNNSGLTLDAGSFTAIDSNVFAGEGLTDVINPGESRLLSYGVDLGTTIAGSQGSERDDIERVEIARGIMKVTRRATEKKTYSIRNNDEKPRTVVIEHPVRGGWKLVSSAQPAESTVRYHRFRVSAQPKTTTDFVVQEESQRLSVVALMDVTPNNLALWVKQRAIDADTERTLASVLAKKNEIGDLATKDGTLESEEEEIDKDQQRLRENLSKLGQSKEEAALRQRYVRTLEQQEDRLAQIRKERAQIEKSREAIEQQIDQILEKLTFERKL